MSDWPDSRLTDEIERLRVRIATIESQELLIKLIKVEALAQSAASNAGECNRKVESLRDAIDKREEDRREEHKSDRRWLVGTGLTSAALVLTAVGLLADKL